MKIKIISLWVTMFLGSRIYWFFQPTLWYGNYSLWDFITNSWPVVFYFERYHIVFDIIVIAFMFFARKLLRRCVLSR